MRASMRAGRRGCGTDRGRHPKDARRSKSGTTPENRRLMALAWPGGKRIAVAVAVMYEAWSEGKAPQYSVQTTSLRPDTVNLSGITWAEYGGRTGVYRIIRPLDRHGIKGTFATSARAAELFPESIKAIVASGHDVAGHAY